MIIWDDELEVNPLCQNSQIIHCRCMSKVDNSHFLFTGVYAATESEERSTLWMELVGLSKCITEPWLIMGDFNNILTPEAKLRGRPVALSDYEEFQWCLDECGVKDLWQQGKLYTWCNQRMGNERVYAKLDRALVNGEWIDEFSDSITSVLMEGVSNHAPIEVQRCVMIQRGKRAFRYFNM
ncbi:OLC1v1024623C1 [Oldenlandia corymbosa var. corymbosa]|uniref:OLC1v1024623C1 n=1 Tax=Oldenlandia corymbosa var. corymbosa TaxID=529605 RepID=A0AAV1C330_OLDCO|nr:OLC1v1024623C1 [Oldenlandia corymbosa var. corymbosa]